MKLITKPQREQLYANFLKVDVDAMSPEDFTVMPVVRIVGSDGRAKVLLVAIDPEYPSHGYGLYSFGGTPEFGFVDLEDLAAPVNRHAHPLATVFKRDKQWIAAKTLGDYLAEAIQAGRIVA